MEKMAPAVTVRTIDEALTVRDGNGASQTVLVDEGALVTLGDLNAGDSVLLSWGDDRVLVITRQ